MEYQRRPEVMNNHVDYKSFINERNQSINIDIEGSYSTARTLEVMKICKIKIIGPFNLMLTMVGWRSLVNQNQSSEKYTILLKVFDKIVLLLFISLLMFSYIYQVLACRFKMNINDQIMTISPAITTKPSVDNTSTEWVNLSKATINKNCTETYILCYHVSTTYIIPNIIHFLAYILGMVHYRYSENDDIYGLMEKTFQYSSTLGTSKSNYSIVSKMLTFWMLISVIWVLLAIVNHILYDISYNTYASPIYIFKIKSTDDVFTSKMKHFMFILDFLGYIIMSMVTVTIVLNYIIYCELIKFYVDAISKKIEMRSIKLNVLKNDIQNVSVCINLINGMIGKMMTLIFILILNLLIVGINNLLANVEKKTLQIVFRFFFVIHLLPLIFTSLIQCGRVNSAIKSFKKWGRHMSVFGYRKESKKELDGFLLFTMGFNSKVRLMALPLESWQLVVFFILFGFALITMIQTGLMDKAELFSNL